MTVSDSYARELVKRIEERTGRKFACLYCDSLRFATRLRPEEIDEHGEEDIIIEIVCGECGFIRHFNMRFFHGEGGVLEESKQ